MRKSQISIFIIFGIIMVIMISMILYIQPELQVKESSLVPKQSYLEECIASHAKALLFYYGPDITPLVLEDKIQECFSYEGIRVDEFSFKGENIYRCNQILIQGSIDSTLERSTSQQFFENYSQIISTTAVLPLHTNSRMITEKDVVLVSPDERMEIFIPKGTRIRTESGEIQDIKQIKIEIQQNGITENQLGRAIYTFSPEKIYLSKPANVSFRLDEDSNFTNILYLFSDGSNNITTAKIGNYLKFTLSRIASGTFSASQAEPPIVEISENNMALIPAGQFMMGDFFSGTTNWETNPHPVKITSSFWIDKYEVTQFLWNRIVSWAIANQYTFDHFGMADGQSYPIHNISWYDAIKWANARSELEGLTPVYYTDANHSTVYRQGQINIRNSYVDWDATGYRLPTHAEWEYAARGGLIGKKYPWGNTFNGTEAHCLDIDHMAGTSAQVGLHNPNAYGLYDMGGNVAEMVWDTWQYFDNGQEINPKGYDDALYQAPFGWWDRVIKGGAWWWSKSYMENGFTFRRWPSYGYRLQDRGVGFRTVRSYANHSEAKSLENYLVIDLLSGSLTYQREIPDLLSNDIYKTTKLVLKKIPQGSFAKGSPTNQPGRRAYPPFDTGEVIRPTTISKDFYIGVFKVTQKQFETIMGYNPTNTNKLNQKYPVLSVNWDAARGGTWPEDRWPGNPNETSFAGRLSALTGISFDLPTEALWEYSCKAGQSTGLYNGLELANPEPSSNDVDGSYDPNAANICAGGFTTITEVGTKKPNDWGLYDVACNGAEWVLDWTSTAWHMDAKTTSIIDPVGVTKNVAQSWHSEGTPKRMLKNDISQGVGGARCADKGFYIWDSFYIPDHPEIYGPGFRMAAYVDSCACSYRYSNWSDCQGGYRHRTLISSFPNSCMGSPHTTEACNITSYPMILIESENKTFIMGKNVVVPVGIKSHQPVHQVTLTYNYYLGEYEVSSSLFNEVYDWAIQNGYDFNGQHQSFGPDHPVFRVTRHDAIKWANALSEKTGLEPVYYLESTHTTVYKSGFNDVFSEQVKISANGYRLPTEAEWEFAARYDLSDWPDADEYPFEDGEALADYVVFGPTTQPIGSKRPGNNDLYDMGGNVFEWVFENWYKYDNSPVINPLQPSQGLRNLGLKYYNTARGGSYLSNWGEDGNTGRYLSWRRTRQNYGWALNRVKIQDQYGFRLARNVDNTS